jgi:hypothetical protein
MIASLVPSGQARWVASASRFQVANLAIYTCDIYTCNTVHNRDQPQCRPTKMIT